MLENPERNHFKMHDHNFMKHAKFNRKINGNITCK